MASPTSRRNSPPSTTTVIDQPRQAQPEAERPHTGLRHHLPRRGFERVEHGGEQYVLRIPGKGTEEYINRGHEARAARETAQLHHIERWRDRLLDEADSWHDFAAQFPGTIFELTSPSWKIFFFSNSAIAI